MTDALKDAVEEQSCVVSIDGISTAAQKGELIIAAAERAGVFIPRFCYHPRMEPVGMCRMCLVEVSGPRGFSLQPACFARVEDGQEVLTSSQKARKAQEGVLEFLLLNHPLDCPVCDKGGECPLQDQALAHGPGESRFIEEKRHFEKPIAIGAFVALDRERCIQCARCTRFAAEIAGEAEIDFAARGDEIEVATFPDIPFSSYFSGNTVQICPVGALTALPYRFKSRPWDLEQVETTCTTCAVGCRVVAQSSAGQLVRYLGVDSDPVNQSWLCDKGRFSHEAVHADNRLVQPLIRRDGVATPSTWHEAMSEIVAGIRWGYERGGPSQIGIIGGSRLTNEDAYAWAKLAKSVIKTDSIDAQQSDGLPAEMLFGLPRATIDDAVRAQVLVLLAPDLREELPILYLRLREAALRKNTTIIECSPTPTALGAHGAIHLSYLPGEAARLVEALCGKKDAEVPGVDAEALHRARSALKSAQENDGVEGASGIVVVIGRASLAESEETIAYGAMCLNAHYPDAKFLSALRRSNVHGALEMGCSPGLLPGRVGLEEARSWYASTWGELPERRGLNTAGILQATAMGELTTLVLLGSDPLADFPDRQLVRTAFERAPFICFVGTHEDQSSLRAHVVVPVAGDAECSGTTTNLEGRISRLAPKVVPPGVSWPAWMVAAEIARRLGSDLGFANLEDIQDEIARVAPSHRGFHPQMLIEPRYRDGVVVPLAKTTVSIGSRRNGVPRPIDPIATPGIASVEDQGAPLRAGATTTSREDETTSQSGARPALVSSHPLGDAPIPPKLDSYSLRLVVNRSLYDSGTLVSSSPSLAPLVCEAKLSVHPLELARLGITDGEMLRVRSARASLEVQAREDASILRNVVALHMNAKGSRTPGGTDAAELIDVESLAMDIHLESI